MKLVGLILFTLLISVAASRRPYTTPSPHGSLRFKLFKCDCIGRVNEIFYPNFTCYAKAYSRDVTTLNGYGMIKSKMHHFWISGIMEYKYGTIYRPVITTKKKDGCDVMQYLDKPSNPLLELILKVCKEVFPVGFLHACPFKNGEEVIANNFSFPVELMPSVFPQGDYRIKVFAFWPTENEQICESTVIYSAISPFKDSFG